MPPSAYKDRTVTSHRLHEQHIEYRRVVVKVGSNLLTGGTARLDAEAMAALFELARAARVEECDVGTRLEQRAQRR